jgi:nanoRNase/pAp phosphatase (c-di-AMP/oligoRNAs hydrolase)
MPREVERRRNEGNADIAGKSRDDANGSREAAKTEAAAMSRSAQLLAAIRARTGGRHVVVIRGYPDPDSLASAWAHCRLAASVGVECEIAHLPLVSRPENRAMINLLELPLVRITQPEELDRYVALSMVDTNSLDLPRLAGRPCVSIVDHHAIGGNVEADFVDIRPHVGATSTIYTEYMLEGTVRSLITNELAGRLATALVYGIRSDTDDLLHATPSDFQAMANLANFVDSDVLAQLSHYAIPATSMRIMRKALEAMQVEGTWAFGGVGRVRPEDRDAIGQAADFLIRREGIRTVITFGLVDNWIDGSLRTTDPSLDPAAWLRDAFGIGPSGLPYGGGRRGKGGFQIPLGPLAGCPNPRALWRVVRETIEDTIRKRIGAAREEEEEEEELLTREADRSALPPHAIARGRREITQADQDRE